MKTRLWLSLVLLLLISLTACQSATPTVVVSTQPAQPSTDSGAYPAPLAEPTQIAPGSASDLYPAPTAGSTKNVPGSASVLYPDPQSGEAVMWNQAEAMILNGEVVKITRQGEKEITIDLKDGRSLIVKGPTEETVQKLFETCGDLCKTIQLSP